MVEMSLIIGTLLLLTLAFVDILRYFGVRGSLIRGAQAGITMAEQIAGYELDIREETVPVLGCPAALTDPPFKQVNCARLQVVNEAARIPLSFMVDPPNTPGSASVLTGYRAYLPHNLAGGWSIWTSGNEDPAGAMRPGEYLCSEGESTGGCGGTPKIICHPTLRTPGGTCPATAMTQQMIGGTGWNQIMAQNPIAVLLRAEMDPVVPWPILGTRWEVKAAAMGFREPPRQYKIMPDMGIPIAPVIPTPTNIPTPIPTPSQCLCCMGRDYGGNCVSGCYVCSCPPADPCN